MRRNASDQPMSDINITPLTDVMMVLLIIFMISSPVLLARGMEVHLPKVEQPPMLAQEDHVLYIATGGAINLDGQIYTPDQIPQAFTDLVNAAAVTRESVNLFIRADEQVTYGNITKVMDAATSAGIEKISLVQEVLTQQETPPPSIESPPAPAESPSGTETTPPPVVEPPSSEAPAGTT
jgi:biopolymer transport protein TolR